MKHDQHARQRELQIGQHVMVKNMPPNSAPKWVPGKIVDILGPVSFLVEDERGRQLKRHLDHLKELGDRPSTETENPHSVDTQDDPPQSGQSNEASEFLSFPVTVSTGETTTSATTSATSVDAHSTVTPTEQPRRYPTRIRHPPDRYPFS